MLKDHVYFSIPASDNKCLVSILCPYLENPCLIISFRGGGKVNEVNLELTFAWSLNLVIDFQGCNMVIQSFSIMWNMIYSHKANTLVGKNNKDKNTHTRQKRLERFRTT